MTLRIYCVAAAVPSAIRAESDLAHYNELRVKYPDDPFFKIGALAFKVDGTLPRREAALLDVYADDEVAGTEMVDADELNRAVRLADAAGWQVVTEANGDAAVRTALNAYAHAIRSNRAPARGRRHRIEHLELADPADMLAVRTARCRRLGAAAGARARTASRLLKRCSARSARRARSPSRSWRRRRGCSSEAAGTVGRESRSTRFRCSTVPSTGSVRRICPRKQQQPRNRPD